MNKEKAKYHCQNGFTMIELLIAVTLISITMLAIGALSSLCANGMALVFRKRLAENYAVALSTKLKAIRKEQLPPGGAFSVDPATGIPIRNTDQTLNLNCSDTYCDRVIVLPSQIEGTSPTEQIIGWSEPMPDGANEKFIRGWSVQDEDPARNWRQISIVIISPNSAWPVTYSVTGEIVN